jgi:prepilin-type N-terminal cleavage/methylation domain-containing protein
MYCRICRRRFSAFTLLELLVVVSIIAVLSGLGLAVSRTVSDQGRKIKEVAAGRTLVTAFLSTTMDNNGRYMIGYDTTAPAMTQPDGTALSGPPVHRYPYRLAPYFNYQMKDTVLVNYNTSQIGKNNLVYMTSLNPALGMNSLFVGGTKEDAQRGISYASECLQTSAAGGPPLLVFASAAYGDGANRVNGFFKLTPPKAGGPLWSSKAWSNKSAAGDYGNVDARYSGRAVCAFTDGSTRLLGIGELRDMRLWNHTAAERNDPNYTPIDTNADANGL